jgi:hypothetical protein
VVVVVVVVVVKQKLLLLLLPLHNTHVHPIYPFHRVEQAMT